MVAVGARVDAGHVQVDREGRSGVSQRGRARGFLQTEQVGGEVAQARERRLKPLGLPGVEGMIVLEVEGGDGEGGGKAICKRWANGDGCAGPSDIEQEGHCRLEQQGGE